MEQGLSVLLPRSPAKAKHGVKIVPVAETRKH